MVKTIQASGTRKKATARGSLEEGHGKVLVNGRSIENYTPKFMKLKIMEPLIIAGKVAEKVNINISINGGGITGQAEAARLVIARMLSEYKKPLKEEFLKYDRNLLVADSRVRESRKPNTQGKARSKKQKSYR
jgi:small subunit ribosomal protein S9